jgi:hypothetical protein
MTVARREVVRIVGQHAVAVRIRSRHDGIGIDGSQRPWVGDLAGLIGDVALFVNEPDDVPELVSEDHAQILVAEAGDDGGLDLQQTGQHPSRQRLQFGVIPSLGDRVRRALPSGVE